MNTLFTMRGGLAETVGYREDARQADDKAWSTGNKADKLTSWGETKRRLLYR
jgi:hypothetical protein